ncbi:MAG: DNA starvation/stationary phase protection protein [Flavobacteriales bacterium]|nr:DNA starvation/stationary phase protection protein [Flavobacteriales bacterium]
MKMDIGISEADRKIISNGLSKVLADSYCLMIMMHNYHWNVKGMNFRQIHLLTEEQYTELFQAVDVIAERIRALGFLAPGSMSEFQSLSSLKEPDSKGTDSQMIADLIQAHEHIAKNSRTLIAKAEDVNDEATADLLTARIELHEKSAWMLRSMLEK